jgi:hypothetical protein
MNTFFGIAAMTFLARFPLHLRIGYIRKLDISRIEHELKRVCKGVENYISYIIWELGHLGILFGLLAWFFGYYTSQTFFCCLIMYVVAMIGSFKWSTFKQGVSRSTRQVARSAAVTWRATTRYGTTARRWILAQAVHWYEDRMNKRRIDKIFERPLCTISIAECLFPDLFIAVPDHPTPSKVLTAIATDLLFFAWNLLIFLIKLRICSFMRIQSHTKEVFSVTAQLLFGLDEDDLSWAAWMACFKVFLRSIRMVLDTICKLIKMFFGGIWILMLIIQAMYNRCIVFFALEKVGVNLEKDKPKDCREETWNAFIETSSYNWRQTANLLLKFKEAKACLAEVRSRCKVVFEQEDTANSLELGKKCVGYRRTLMEVVSDNNYLRLLLCSVLNAQHNSINGKTPSALNSEHPYQPSLIKFTPVPDAKTGLYIGYMKPTRRKENSFCKEYRINMENFTMDIEREPQRVSTIIKRRQHLRGNVPNGLDPFLKDHWAFSAAIPGLYIPHYSEAKNPFDISAKRP